MTRTLSRISIIALATALALSVGGCSAVGNKPAAAHTATKSPKPAPVAVVNVVGETYTKARNDLFAGGFVTVLDADNADAETNSDLYTVTTQDPAADAMALPGAMVTIHLEPIMVKAPNVVGKHYADAQATIEAASGSLTSTSPQDDEADDDWTVKAQSPAAGKAVPAGTQITLTLQAPRVVFTITGNGGSSNVITYTIPGSTNIEQAADARLPWTKSFPYTGDGLIPNGNISAQDEDGTSITCTISVGGQIVDKQTATGQYAIVQCGG